MDTIKKILKGEDRLIEIDRLIANSKFAFSNYWHARTNYRKRHNTHQRTDEIKERMVYELNETKNYLKKALIAVIELEDIVNASLDNSG